MQTEGRAMSNEAPIYVLGHSNDELQRLIRQSLIFEDITERFLVKAGICSGMRVLDLGCGTGDVSFAAARIVGRTGSVVGVDKSPESIMIARTRAQEQKLENVAFVESEITNLALNDQVDAVIGRFVLMYAADPVEMLRRVARYVHSDGIIAFQEFDFSNVPTSYPRSKLFEEFAFWSLATLGRGRVETQMGLRLYQTFLQAGLSAPRVTIDTSIHAGSESPIYDYLAQTLKSMLPMAEKFGITTAEEVQIETFADRLRSEVCNFGSVIVTPYVVGAWTQK